MTLLDCTDPEKRETSLDAAVEAVTHGGLIVLPTDTVYGVAADAFDKDAVAALLAAKGRGRQKPPPVLVGDHATLDGLATDVPDVVRSLVERFWPGALTIIVKAQPSLTWDLGYTRGSVALRMPDDEIALAVLRRSGPLATSSANRTGRPAATTAADAQEQLGARVGVYLDGGPARGGEASTIIDATGPTLTIVREGALSVEELGEVAPELLPTPPEEEKPAEEVAAEEAAPEVPAAEDAVPADKVPAAEDAVAADEVPAAEDAVPADEVPAAEDAVPADEVPAAEDAVAADEVPAPVAEPDEVPAPVAEPAEEPVAADEAPAPTEDGTADDAGAENGGGRDR